MEQNLQIHAYTRHFSVHIFQYIEPFPTVEDYSTSRHESSCRLCAYKLYLASYYTALQNVHKSSIDLNGPPRRSQVCNFFIFTAAKKLLPLSLATGFVLLISYHSASSPVI